MRLHPALLVVFALVAPIVRAQPSDEPVPAAAGPAAPTGAAVPDAATPGLQEPAATQQPTAQEPAAVQEPAAAPGPAAPSAPDAEPAAELPAEHRPQLTLKLEPKSGVQVGDAVHLTIEAVALAGDDVAVPEQSFAPFEIVRKNVRLTPEKAGRQRFVFELDLLALESGPQSIAPIELRVVTQQGFVGSVRTEGQTVSVGSALANEPDAKLKPETKPVVVMQDDFTLLYALAALVGAALVALLTWLVVRYLQRRVKPAPPPPPPRPPWEVAVEKLGDLRRRKQSMVEAGAAAQFVDEVSDVAREYLGARFGFDGLESTTDEALRLLKLHGCNAGLLQEVGSYLRRCDLIKFASVDPDRDEADLVFAKAHDIVQFSTPLDDAYAAAGEATGVAAARAKDARPPSAPSDPGAS